MRGSLICYDCLERCIKGAQLSVGNVAKWIIGVVCSVLICGLPLPGRASERGAVAPATGLMWNRTGLPAVFPLQVKTPGGQDYFLTLYDSKTGEAALAAYIKGGSFFKVLVPPGTYDLRFASGTTWISEDALFGDADRTQLFGVKEPLKFAIRDFSTKAGHLVNVVVSDSQKIESVTIADQYLCQTQRIVEFPRLQPSFDDVESYRLRIPDDGKLMRMPPRYSQERLLDGGDRPVFSTRYAPYFSLPEYEVRANPCW